MERKKNLLLKVVLKIERSIRSSFLCNSLLLIDYVEYNSQLITLIPLSKPIHDVDENERLLDPVIEDDPEQPKVAYRKRSPSFFTRLLC